MMLRQEKTGTNSLLEKNDNSALLPVDAERLMDYSVDNTNNDNDSEDSNDTIVLQK